MSSRVLIVYTTTLGNTERMANAAAEGVSQVDGVTADLRTTDNVSRSDVAAADGLLIGTPVRHRSMDARVKTFIEDTLEILWLKDELVGRVGGVFSVGGGYGNQGAGVEIAQLGILAAMAACGMVLVPFPKCSPGAGVAGSHWGAHGRSGGPEMEPTGVSEEMLVGALHHGSNVARVTQACAGRDLFARGNVAPSMELVKLFAGS